MSTNHLGTVLILEDDPGVNLLQTRKLERNGYTVANAFTTEEALAKIHAGGVDLIVLDYGLNGMVSGVEFYRQLQIAGHALPAILVTGFSDEARLIEALRAGVRDFLPKTADFLEFLAPTVERVMRQVRAERRAAESEKFRQTEERFRTSVENMLDGFGIYSAVRDISGRIIDFRVDYVNAAACALTGRSHEEQVGQGLHLLEPTGLELTLVERGSRVVGSGEPFSADGLLIESPRKLEGGLPSTHERWFDVRITKLGDGVVATWRDATERIRYEAEIARARLRAENASRAKDEFLATVSHELRTPLNAILGWVQLLGVEDIDAETKKDAILTIERNAKSQARLIEDLIDISRIVSGKLRLEMTSVDVGCVIQAAVDAAKPAAEARSLAFTVALDPLAGRISGDPDRIQQIAWNLISNAIKFTPVGGSVNVELRRAPKQELEIAVSDSGKGIDPEFLPYVFDRFTQADASSTRHYSGLGLGLAITRHMVELHGGSIEAASQGEGHGATFTVHLPLVSTLHVGPQEVPAVGPTVVASERGLTGLPRDLEGIRVVAVDDDADARHILKTVLEYCKADAIVVATAEAALRAMKEQLPDALLSDVEMAGEDGYSLIRRVRSLPPEFGGNTPAAALTAYARPEDRRRLLNAGFQMHVPKPIEASMLAEIIRKLVDGGVQSVIDQRERSLQTSTGLRD